MRGCKSLLSYRQFSPQELTSCSFLKCRPHGFVDAGGARLGGAGSLCGIHCLGSPGAFVVRHGCQHRYIRLRELAAVRESDGVAGCRVCGTYMRLYENG
jgi:hypothetical protein